MKNNSLQSTTKTKPPILLFCILVLYPIITRCIYYRSGLSGYDWASAEDGMIDFYIYYKSRIFLLISILAGIILIYRLILYRDSFRRFDKIGIIILLACIIGVSTIFSISPSTSVKGGFAHFESAIVWIGYLIWMLYLYQVVRTKQDYRYIRKFLYINATLLCFVGFLQLTGNGILGNDWIRRLVMNQADYEQFGDNLVSAINTKAISLTFGNPNYAGVNLCMLLTMMTALLCLSYKEMGKIERMISLLLTAGIVFLLVSTYTRTAFVGLACSFLLFAFCLKERKILIGKLCLSGGKIVCMLFFFSFVLFFLFDGMRGFYFTQRLKETWNTVTTTEEKNNLEAIITGKEDIQIKYKGKELFVSIKEPDKKQTEEKKISLTFQDKTGEDLTSLYEPESGKLPIEPWSSLQFFPQIEEGKNKIKIEMEGKEWIFIKYEDGYYFYNDFFKEEKLEEVKTMGFQNLEKIGSGRGYIWSRSLPLLKKYWLTGSGIDTFPMIFPQNDRVGKLYYCKERFTIIEKPHNLYLQMALQTGIFSLLLFLLLYGIHFVKAIRYFRRASLTKEEEIIGLGAFLAGFCYLICGFFVDSSIQTSPFFWTYLGISLGVTEQIKFLK